MRTDLIIEGAAGAAAAILTAMALERVRPAEKLENAVREAEGDGPPPRRRPRPRLSVKLAEFIVAHVVFRGVMAGSRAGLKRLA